MQHALPPRPPPGDVRRRPPTRQGPRHNRAPAGVSGPMRRFTRARGGAGLEYTRCLCTIPREMCGQHVGRCGYAVDTARRRGINGHLHVDKNVDNDVGIAEDKSLTRSCVAVSVRCTIAAQHNG